MLIPADITRHSTVTEDGSSQQSVEDMEVTEEQQIKEACEELREHFNHRLVESLLKATRYSLDVMRRRFFSGYVALETKSIKSNEALQN